MNEREREALVVLQQQTIVCQLIFFSLPFLKTAKPRRIAQEEEGSEITHEPHPDGEIHHNAFFGTIYYYNCIPSQTLRTHSANFWGRRGHTYTLWSWGSASRLSQPRPRIRNLKASNLGTHGAYKPARDQRTRRYSSNRVYIGG